MPSRFQRYDPLTNKLYDVTPEGVQSEADYTSLLNGQYIASGNILYDPNNPIGHQIRLGQQGDTQITYLDYDRAVVLTPIQLSGVNALRNTPELASKTEPMQQGQFVVQTVIGGSANFALGDGTQVQVEGIRAGITGYGMRIIGREVGGQLVDIQRRVVDARTNADLQADLGAEWRFASPTEAAGYALKHWALDNRRTLINRIANQGGLPGSPLAQGDFSGALNLFVSLLARNLQAFASYTVQL